MDNKYKYMVRVSCMTYNHAKYIEDALNGFTMQKATFPFVCTIIDDYSTDGEQEIITRYLVEHFDLTDESTARNEETDDYRLVFARHKTNHSCYFAVLYLKYNHYSIKKAKSPYLAEEWINTKFIAICEGDDYWTDPMKLQVQVDFFESHPKHSLCFHAISIFYSDGTNTEYYTYKDDKEECPMKDIILGGGGFMATNSIMYARDYYNESNKPIWVKKCHVGDLPLMLTLAERGDVGYICKNMSCYRYASEGSWTQRIISNKKEYKEHIRRSKQLWIGFDEWSNYKYHRYVKIKIMKNFLNYLLDSNAILNKMVAVLRKIYK